MPPRPRIAPPRAEAAVVQSIQVFNSEQEINPPKRLAERMAQQQQQQQQQQQRQQPPLPHPEGQPIDTYMAPSANDFANVTIAVRSRCGAVSLPRQKAHDVCVSYVGLRPPAAGLVHGAADSPQSTDACPWYACASG
jgi:hypothetical protein